MTSPKITNQQWSNLKNFTSGMKNVHAFDTVAERDAWYNSTHSPLGIFLGGLRAWSFIIVIVLILGGVGYAIYYIFFKKSEGYEDTYKIAE